MSGLEFPMILVNRWLKGLLLEKACSKFRKRLGVLYTNA